MQKLLQHPELSNSQLLADFLSPHSMESQFLDKMLPDVNLGTVRDVFITERQAEAAEIDFVCLTEQVTNNVTVFDQLDPGGWSGGGKGRVLQEVC